MPNQRKKGKTRIAVWLTKTQRIAIEQVVQSGVVKDMSDFVIQAIKAEQQRQGGKNGDGR